MKNGSTGAVVGLVLAGGLAERMGACKALLPLSGRSALEQVVKRMRAAKVSEIIVVTGGYEERIYREALRCGCRPVFNPAYRSGMFSSVLAGVRALPERTEAFFLLPADTPLVKPATYRSLIEAFFGSSANPAVVYPTFCGVRGHPPLIGRTMIRMILEWDGTGGLRGLLERYPERGLDIRSADRATLLDMDTPGDYAILRRYCEGEAYPDEDECLELLAMAGTPTRVVRHAKAVAGCACLLGEALASSGMPLNLRLLNAACLLHDIAKGEPDHEARGARWLHRRGYGEVAKLVAMHKNLPKRKSAAEAEILYLADKITDGETVSTLEHRLLRMELRFALEREALEAAKKRIKRAREIQRKVERLTGKRVREILGQR